MNKFGKVIAVLIVVLALGWGAKSVGAQSQSVLYVPLIGITSVPDPLALPAGAGNVTFHYAVKNFIKEVSLTGIQIADDVCSPALFEEGDDNGNFKLDYNETWRYACTTRLSTTTQSTVTVVGSANNITATHRAYATVVVGSNNLPPLVSIVNITKVAYPLSLPAEGGAITFTYRVNNPGEVALSDVVVSDDKCSAIFGKLGDTNGNNQLDVNEVWIYTCTANLTETTTNTVNVTAYANGLKAVGSATITVEVDTLPGFPNQDTPNFPETGEAPPFKIAVWGILSAILVIFAAVSFVLMKRRKSREDSSKSQSIKP